MTKIVCWWFLRWSKCQNGKEDESRPMKALTIPSTNQNRGQVGSVPVLLSLERGYLPYCSVWFMLKTASCQYCPRSGKLRTQKLKSRLMRTQSLNVLPLKSGVCQYIAMYATHTARDFFPCSFLPFRSIRLHFFPNPSRFFLCWLWLTHGFCVGPQNKMGHRARGRFLCWVPAECKQAKK